MSSEQLDNEPKGKGRSPGWRQEAENRNLRVDFNTMSLDRITYGVNADKKEKRGLGLHQIKGISQKD